MEAVAIVTMLAVLQVFFFAAMVGKARVATGLKAPACDGAPEFQRANRVHLNTVEQFVLVMPSMWVFATYVHALAAAGLGLLYLIGRFVYRAAYMSDPGRRGPGFLMGVIALAVLAVGGIIGAGMDLANI